MAVLDQDDGRVRPRAIAAAGVPVRRNHPTAGMSTRRQAPRLARPLAANCASVASSDQTARHQPVWDEYINCS
jgi:hypothetical protein